MSSRLSVRRSQLVTPYGVGSICEIDGQSFIVRDTSWWNSAELTTIQLEQVTNRLHGISSLRSPRGSVPVSRFPRWLFCPTCRQMTNWSYRRDVPGDDGQAPQRPTCDNKPCKGAALVPMRFVQVCDNGHVDDIDWHWLAHRGNQPAATGSCDRKSARLKFLVRGERGGDFDSMSIKCTCGAGSSLEGIANGPVGNCSARQPWQSRGECDKKAFMEPRGSSVLHYAQTLSALDISADQGDHESPRERLISDVQFNTILQMVRDLGPELANNPMTKKQVAMAAEKLGIEDDEAWAVFTNELVSDVAVPAETGGSEQEASEIQSDIYDDEFGVLSDPTPSLGGSLIRVPSALDANSPLGLHRFFNKVVQVESLREVRVFRGFQRRDVSSDHALIDADLGKGIGWLPAIDVRGEGIFLELNRSALREWLDKEQEQLRAWTAPQLDAADNAGLSDRFSARLGIPFLLVHTLAHLLMNQLSFDCGYSSTSLRERIYCGPGEYPFAGLLIYTADSDAEGSMGGLVEMGEPTRFANVLARAVSRSQWCSGDPVCRELPQQGMRGLNRSACHACCLVAETSCTHANALLNRVLVSGEDRTDRSGNREPIGFLGDLLDKGA
jgi:hypothetical protein